MDTSQSAAFGANSPQYHGVSHNQFSALDSQTIASVDKISLNAPGSRSAWMHRLTQYLRMMPLRFAASSTILLAIIVLICILAFRIARHKIRGQDAYETCMEKLAEYRIPGTMYINTKKFHEFLKSTEKQPAVRSWQLSKQSPQVSEASTSLPTHTNDYSMLRVHRTGLTRPRSRSNGSSYTPAHTGHVSIDSPAEDNVEVVEKVNLTMGDTTIRRNNAITNAFLEKKFNTNNVQSDKCVLNEVHHSSDQATNHDLGNNHKETHRGFNDHSQEAAAAKLTVNQSLTKDLNVVNKTSADPSTHTRQDAMPATVSMEDFNDTFVLVEGKKKKKTKVHNKLKISPQPSVPHSKDINHESTKRHEELINEVTSTDKTVQPEPSHAKETPVPTVMTSKHGEDSHIREQKENSETEKTFVESNTSLADSPKPSSPQSLPSYGSNWYSPFSSGLQLDILPRQEPSYYPKVPSHNIHSESMYGNNSGVVMNQRRHYQQSSLPRNPSPKNLVGRERLHEQPFQPSGFTSVSPAYNYQPYNMSHRLEQGHWPGSSQLASDDSADKNYGLEFSLFDREWP
ncbi:hypothetical protein INT43_005486 [Umbelopsis isabellina]|uniref:Uncharacterized protein n=1 Tax=Mortierella isabellina TaxID=91625 RepID=A0A8H7PLJ8_MORIS|nr:hypothetical protein INT43_005486 [Umbelopsis isabellina]